MALNVEQKKVLDNTILNYITTHMSEWVFYKDLRMAGEDILNITLNVPTISASLNRIMKDNSFNYSRQEFNKGVAYKFRKYNYGTLTKVIKDKNILTFKFNNDKNIHYDFQTNEYLEENTFNSDTIDDFASFSMIKALLPYEWLFNYMTNIRELRNLYSNVPKNVYEKMPKGLVNYLKENQIDQLTTKILQEYYNSITYTPNELRFMNEFSLSFLEKVNKTIGLNNLNKMIIASAKNYELYDLKTKVLQLIDYLNSVEYKDIILDTNRGVGYNLGIVQKYINKHANEVLEKNLQKLNFINGLNFNDYIVVVPQTVEDKINEGNMQHNCVGYHYDDSIRAGKNLIYFLRNKNTPNKSLVTCRYNIEQKATVEARRVNNSNCKEKDFCVIKEIDNIIRENLK